MLSYLYNILFSFGVSVLKYLVFVINIFDNREAWEIMNKYMHYNYWYTIDSLFLYRNLLFVKRNTSSIAEWYELMSRKYNRWETAQYLLVLKYPYDATKKFKMAIHKNKLGVSAGEISLFFYRPW